MTLSSATTPIDPVTHWRLQPGFLRDHALSSEAVQLLLGCFLADRTSADPLLEVNLFAEDGTFEWGHAPPLEKVIQTPSDLARLLHHPELYQTALTIIEPWEHVGINAAMGEPVRASKNIAFIAQKVADCDSILLPLWSSGVINLDQVIPMLAGSLAVIVEGGQPSVHNPAEWTHPACSQAEMMTFIERLLLARSPRSAPALFICLGHQLAAAGHIRILQRVVREVLATDAIQHDPDGEAIAALNAVCQFIREIGESLQIQKRDGRIVAQGWQDAHFAVSRNEAEEIGSRILEPYQAPHHRTSGIPLPLLNAHQRIAHEEMALSDVMTTIRYEHNFAISMFHYDEVNEEAILFANWAYLTLYDAIVPYRYTIAASPLSWLLQLPYGVRIVASTMVNEHALTECSCTSITYKDLESQAFRRSFTCQFHPELLDDLREIGRRSPPSYADLKQSDGVRLLLRFMYYGMSA